MRKTKGLAAAAQKLTKMAELSPITELDLSHIQIDDGKPVDNIFSERQMRLLVDSLYSSWRDEAGNRRVFAAFANVGLFYGLHEPPVVPDVMVTIGVQPKPMSEEKSTLSYFVWEYGGKPPDIVIEVVSNREGGEDTTKLERYAAIGVSYYVIYDPMLKLSRRPLRVYERHGGRFVEFLDPLVLPGMNLGVGLWKGEFEGYKAEWLRWFAGGKQMLQAGAELAEEASTSEAKALKAAAEARQAESEARRAEVEARESARAAEERAARMSARLRELGIEEP